MLYLSGYILPRLGKMVVAVIHIQYVIHIRLHTSPVGVNGGSAATYSVRYTYQVTYLPRLGKMVLAVLLFYYVILIKLRTSPVGKDGGSCATYAICYTHTYQVTYFPGWGKWG